MRLEPCEVATLVTATGDQQIVFIFASGDAAQFQLARRTLFACACDGGQREANVAFDGGDN